MKKIFAAFINAFIVLYSLGSSMTFCDEVPPLIPLEKFFEAPQMDICQISPDGQWLSYLKPYQGRLNVFVRGAIGSTQDRPLTAEKERPVLNYFWSADSSRILYLQDHLGDENYHLFSVSVGEKAPISVDLTPFQGVTVEVVSIPHGSVNILITMNKRNPELMDAYWLDIDSKKLRLAAQNPGNFTGFLDDLSHQVRVGYGLNLKGETEIYERPNENAKWRFVKKYGPGETISALAFHADGKHIYLKSSSGRDLAGLVLLNLANGEETFLSQDPENESDLVDALFDSKTHQLLATLYEGDVVRTYGLTPEIKNDLEIIRKQKNGNLIPGAASDDHKRWIIHSYSPTNPGQSYLYDRHKGKLDLICEFRPWLKPEQLSEAKPISYVSKDGLTIHGYLTLPSGIKPVDLPMVLYVHGGPWARDQWRFDSDVQFLANRGYAVLQVNYRGSTGFGKKFAYAARKEFAGAMHQDLISGVNWAIDKKIADPHRVAIMGASYGGYATLVGLTFTPDQFACAVDYSGPSSLITLVESFPPSWRPFLPRRWFPMVGDPSRPEDREDMKKRSPLYYVDRIQSPLMIYQGVNDPRVTREQSDRMVIALRDRGIQVKYLLAKDEGHGLDNPENALAVSHATEEFLGSCLKGRVQEKVDPKVEEQLRQMTVDVNSLK